MLLTPHTDDCNCQHLLFGLTLSVSWDFGPVRLLFVYWRTSRKTELTQTLSPASLLRCHHRNISRIHCTLWPRRRHHIWKVRIFEGTCDLLGRFNQSKHTCACLLHHMYADTHTHPHTQDRSHQTHCRTPSQNVWPTIERFAPCSVPLFSARNRKRSE